MKNTMRLFIILTLVITCIFCLPMKASAELLITPTLVVIKDKQRFATVTLVNTSDSTKTYEMGIGYTRMIKEGAMYENVEKSITDFDLGAHIMFTPRRITLAPKATQKIRLAVRRPAEPIPDGDYRVHLKFSSVPSAGDIAAMASAKEASHDAKTTGEHGEGSKVSAGVKIYVGFTIPVVLRVGEPKVKAQIEQISVSRNEAGKMQVTVPVRREGGPYSVFGHLLVYHIGADGKEERVGEISNAHIFPEVDSRTFNVTLVKEISGGSLRVLLKNNEYTDEEIYNERVFPVGG